MIRKVGRKFRVVARTGRNMGTYDTRAEAEDRLQQIEMFKSLAARGTKRSRSPRVPRALKSFQKLSRRILSALSRIS
jgi:hypothetical protein